jgi:hypothetical protein
VLEKWKNDNLSPVGLKENEDGTFTGYFFKSDGTPPITKVYKSEEDFEANKEKDRIELLQLNQK